MARCRQIFVTALGVEPVGFRTPSGDWGADTPRVLVEAGIVYLSSMRGDDPPYIIDVGDAGQRMVEIPRRWGLADYASLAYQREPKFPARPHPIAGYQSTPDQLRPRYC